MNVALPIRAEKPSGRPAELIDAWRGRCLNHYSRAEGAVGKALEACEPDGPSISLAGKRAERLADLLGSKAEFTDKQRRAFLSSLSALKRFSEKRGFLAHGIATILYDGDKRWHLWLEANRHHWVICGEDIDSFESELKKTCVDACSRLGQIIPLAT